MPRALVAALLVAIAANAPAADLMVRQRLTTTGGPGGGPRTEESTEYITAKLSVSDGSSSRTIVDLEAKTLTMIDKQRKTYAVMTFDDLRRRGEEMRKKLDELPPEVRRRMSGDADATVKPTGRTERIAGYDAKEYSLEAGIMKGSIWTTEAIPTPGDRQQWKQFASASGATQGPGGKVTEALANIEGFPLRTVITQEMGPVKVTMTNETLEVRQQSPPPGMVTVPDGFRRMEGSPAQ